MLKKPLQRTVSCTNLPVCAGSEGAKSAQNGRIVHTFFLEGDFYRPLFTVGFLYTTLFITPGLNASRLTRNSENQQNKIKQARVKTELDKLNSLLRYFLRGCRESSEYGEKFSNRSDSHYL